MTLFEMKESMNLLGNEIKANSEWLVTNAPNPSTDMKEIEAKKQKNIEIQARLDILKAEHDRVEAEQRAELKAKSEAPTQENSNIKAKADFYRGALTKDMSRVKAAYQHLGAIPAGSADLGGGENLLPTNMSNEIVSEPFDENPMRNGATTITQATNLELPKIAYKLDDDAFITDLQVAKEIELTGDKVTFGRFKTKIKVEVSDTVMRGTDLNLTSYIDNALRSGLATKEKKVQFATAPVAGEEHMSFYSAVNAITTVTGSTMYDAISAALADLNDAFNANAKIVMRRSDYFAMIKELANGSATLWGAKPEDVLGYPVIFCDKAVKPIVGDFSYSHLNYDIGTTYDADKDVDMGVYKFVLTTWFDHQIKLASAFRIAEVTTTP